jgi:hypothetical protein
VKLCVPNELKVLERQAVERQKVERQKVERQKVEREAQTWSRVSRKAW